MCSQSRGKFSIPQLFKNEYQIPQIPVKTHRNSHNYFIKTLTRVIIPSQCQISQPHPQASRQQILPDTRELVLTSSPLLIGGYQFTRSLINSTRIGPAPPSERVPREESGFRGICMPHSVMGVERPPASSDVEVLRAGNKAWTVCVLTTVALKMIRQLATAECAESRVPFQTDVGRWCPCPSNAEPELDWIGPFVQRRWSRMVARLVGLAARSWILNSVLH